MKSNNMLIGIALLFLILAVAASVAIWDEVSSPVKIGMFAFGFGSGVAAGALINRRRNQLAG
jgi:tellurite resistance protein TehA-like permease